MKRGEIYCADLNHVIGSEQGGNRPVLILSNDVGNKFSNTVIIACLTSKRKKLLPTHVTIRQQDIYEESTVLLEQIRTIDKQRISKYICTLSDDTMKQIDDALRISLDLKERSDNENMDELKVINVCGVECFEKEGTAYLKLETVARGLGFTRVAASGNEVIRWERVDGYLKELGVPTCGHEDFIPENIFYRLAMKAKNEVAEKFQAKVADEIIPSIRKTGGYGFKPMTPEQMMRVQLGMIDGHESRITKLENTMNIDYGQQRVLEREVAATVIKALGGKDSNAYRDMNKKVFSECNHDIKDYFCVNSRNNIPRVKFDEAVEYIKNWEPCSNTKMRIKESNAQMRM